MGSRESKFRVTVLIIPVNYLLLKETTGRLMREGTRLSCIHANTGLALPIHQRGAINATLPSILERLNLDIDTWLIRMQGFEYSSVENIIHRSMAPAITVLGIPSRQLFSKHAIRSKAA